MTVRSPGPSLQPPYPWELPGDVGRFIHRYGTERVGSPVPDGWRRRRNRAPGGCYAAAARWASRDDDVLYTEGIALWTRDTWLPHAWLTTAEGHVIDLAWDDPSPRYLGVALPGRVMAEAWLQLGYHGPLLPIIVAAGWAPGQDTGSDGGVANG